VDTGPICWKADRSRRFLVEVQPHALEWVVLGPANLGSAEPQSFDRFLAFGPPDPEVPPDVVATLTGIIESRPDAEIWRQRAQDLLSSQQEDPERRVRALERQLSGSDGAAYTERSASPAARAGWIVLAVMVIALLVSGAVIIAQQKGRPGAGSPGSLGSPGKGPTERSAPSSAPAASGDATASRTELIVVTGVETTRALACEGGAVSVSGAANTVFLTGECSRVEVSGVGNSVTVDAAAAIVVSGSGNRGRFRSGQPAVEKSGTGNTVERG